VLTKYRNILSLPGATSFMLAGLIARFPISMYGLGAVLLVQSRTGSYFKAGLVSASVAIAAAVGGPITSRLVDRLGQNRLIPILLSLHVSTLLIMIYLIINDANLIIVIILAIISGASQPTIGPFIRARWKNATRNRQQENTAFAMESVLDEVIFIFGPPLVTFLCVVFFDASGLLLAAILVTLGGIWLSSQFKTQPEIHVVGAERGKAALRYPGIFSLFLVYILLGAVFGAAEVIAVAFSRENGSPQLAGALITAWSVGSLAAGIAMGTIHFKNKLSHRFLIASFFFALSLVPLPFISTLPALFVTLLISGLAISPVLISGYTLIGQLVPQNRLTEGFAWANTGAGLGIALASAISGWVIDNSGAQVAFWVVTSAGLLTFVITLITYRDLKRADSRSAKSA
jgi:MFS family permease